VYLKSGEIFGCQNGKMAAILSRLPRTFPAGHIMNPFARLKRNCKNSLSKVQTGERGKKSQSGSIYTERLG